MDRNAPIQVSKAKTPPQDTNAQGRTKAPPRGLSQPIRTTVQLCSGFNHSGEGAVQPLVQAVVHSAGHQLETGVRDLMESTFCHDFSAVRIHTDGQAAESARTLRANAYTIGKDLVFAQGRYAPKTTHGRKLLAHELAHVVHQSRAISGDEGEAEAEAARAASALEGGEQAIDIGLGTGLCVQRDPDSSSQPAGSKRKVRIDYQADPRAYMGLELAYTAEPPVEGIQAPGVYRSQLYWIAPHLRAGTELVVYYIAYNPQASRNEWVVGPNNIQHFLENERLHFGLAQASYPAAGEMPDYKALSGRVAARAMQGDVSGMFRAWKDSWAAAVKSPQFWIEATMATGAAAIGGATKVPTTPAAEGLAADVSADVDQSFAKTFDQTPRLPKAAPRVRPTLATPNADVPPQVVESSGASPRGQTFQSASAQTTRSVNTAIRADLGESAAYKAALSKGEIGLQRPGGSNVPGVDFITAGKDSTGQMRIYVNDAKTSGVGNFPRPKSAIPAAWHDEVSDAVSSGRLKVDDPALEAEIRDAAAKGNIVRRQVNVDYSPSGQGNITFQNP